MQKPKVQGLQEEKPKKNAKCWGTGTAEPLRVTELNTESLPIAGIINPSTPDPLPHEKGPSS